MAVDETATPLERVLRDHGAWIAVRHGQRVAVHFGSVAAETNKKKIIRETKG